MSLPRQYLTAQMPSTFQVGGIRLQPYCLGHAVLLARLGNPLVWERPGRLDRTPRPAIGKGDCLWALWILSRPATEAMRLLESWRVVWWMRWQGWRLRHLETKELTDWLRGFILHGSEGPLWRAKHKPSAIEPGTPLLLVLKRNQMTAWGRSEAEAFNQPLRLVKWEYCAWLEQEDALVIKEPEENVIEAIKKVAPNFRPITAADFAILKQGGNPWAGSAAEQPSSPPQTLPSPATGQPPPATRRR